MSNRDPNASYSSTAQAEAFVLHQWQKGLHTAFPARVERYDAATRRANVLPLLDILTTDGELVPRAVISDVPVVQPHAGGLAILMPVSVGDVVWCVVAERGIERFKRTFARSAPEAGMHAEKDAVALPGFGPLSISPADAAAVSIQSDDGRVNVRVSATDGVTVESPDGILLDGDVRVTGSLEVEGTNLTHGGTNVGRTHRHTGVLSGMAVSGPPQP